MDPTQRLCCLSGAILLVLAYGTGLLIAGAASGTLQASVSVITAAHLNALFGTLLLVALAWTLPHLSFGEAGRRVIAWCFIVSGYANWAVTLAKAFLGVKGIALVGHPANDAVFALLTLFVVIPSLAGAVGWGVGLARRGDRPG